MAAKILDRVIAVVNDEIVLQSEVDQFVIAQRKAMEETESPEAQKALSQLRKKALDDLVDARLIAQHAVELKLSVTQEEVDRAQEEVRSQNKLDEAGFREALKQQGFTMEAYRKNLKRQILNLKVMRTAVQSRVSVSEDDVRAYYKQSESQMAQTSTVHLRQILLAVPDKATPIQVETRRQEAAKLIEQMRAGKDFDVLAKKFSEDPSAKENGGDMGWIEKGTLVDALDKAVEGMEPGDVRGPIRTERGWHVLKVVDKKNANLRPFEEVKDKLRQQLYEQQVEKATQAWLRELRRKAHIDIRL